MLGATGKKGGNMTQGHSASPGGRVCEVDRVTLGQQLCVFGCVWCAVCVCRCVCVKPEWALGYHSSYREKLVKPALSSNISDMSIRTENMFEIM